MELPCFCSSSLWSLHTDVLSTNRQCVNCVTVLPFHRKTKGSNWRPKNKIDMQWSAEEISKRNAELETVYGPAEILKILPHRFPFLLVDRVVEFEAGKRAVGLKNVSFNEPQFTGHFPEKPVFPGVYMLEALAQLGGIVMLQPPISENYREFYFAGVTQVRFRKPVIPGDTLVMQMEVISVRPQLGIGKMSGKGYVDGKLAVEGEFTFSVQS